MTADLQSLSWAIQRLAALRGASVHQLELDQAIQSLMQAKSDPSTQNLLTDFCRRMHWAAPTRLLKLDPTQLPALLRHEPSDWLVVRERTAEGLWRVENQTGQHDTGLEPEAFAWQIQFPTKTADSQAAWAMIRKAFFQHKTTLLEGALATALINVIALAASFFSMQVYDRVIPSQGYNTLVVLSAGVLLAIVFEFLLKYARSRVMEHAVVNLDSTLSRDVFQRLLNIRLDQMPHSVGSLAGQLRAYEGIRALLTASTAYLLVDIPFAIFFIAVMMLLGSVYLGLIPLVFLVISLLTGLALKRSIQKAALQGAGAANQKTGLLVEAVEGAETIKSGLGGWRFLSRWIDINHQSIGYDLKIRHLSELGGFLTAAFQQLSYAGLIALGAWQVMEGHVTMGALIACSILSGRALTPAGMLPGLMVQYAHAKAALEGLEKVYALKSDNAGMAQPLLPDNLRGHYRLEAVRYAYQINSTLLGSTQNALDIGQLVIQPGEKIAVLGMVGSGKSTLLRLLSGLYQPRTGRILLDDLELSHIARQRLSEQVGYLQQDHRLFQGTLKDNLLIGLADSGDDALMQAARETGLIHLITEHPLGLHLPIAEGGKGLSGGQRQLVALTRLVLTRPRIWLLDEPTASMDGESEQRCIELLKRHIQPQHTMVLVTHKPALIPLADRVIVMARQRVLLDGPRDAVLQKLVAQGGVK
jgi:ATP-binding cassette, subfamily C, bacterial LapB